MWEFNCLYFLTKEIDEFLIEGAEQKFQEFLKVYEGYDSWKVQEIRMQGVFTVSDFIKLGEKDPKKLAQYQINQLKSTRVSLKGNELEMFNEDFPKISWESLTVMSFSTLENVLKRLIIYVAENEEIDLSLMVNGNIDYLDFLKDKIKQDLKIDFDFGGSKEWCLIKERKEIRNLITHNGGFLPKDDLKIRKLIKRNNDVSLNGERISITKNFVQKTVEHMQNFVIELLDEIGEKYT